MRQGFFGIKNTHIALITNEEELTFDTPVSIPGTVNLSVDAEIGTSASYADNEVWIDGQQDNGFTGTITFFDTWSTSELRALFAKLTGRAIDTKGREMGIADRDPQPFALMCEQPGSVAGKRICYYHCQLTKPSMEAATNEDSPEIQELSYDFTIRPVTITNGEGASANTVRTTYYADYEGSTTYSTFFNAVDKTCTEATA